MVEGKQPPVVFGDRRKTRGSTSFLTVLANQLVGHGGKDGGWGMRDEKAEGKRRGEGGGGMRDEGGGRGGVLRSPLSVFRS
jgi:hypothetical protein